MQIAVIGISHKEAPVPIRGLVAFTTSSKKEATRVLLKAGLSEFMVISTCNRSEIYMATTDMSRDIELVKKYYVSMAGHKIEPYIFIKKYEVAIQHIYQVAAGLNSLIIGEDEILGQMKRAMDFAIDHKSSKKVLTKVIREAITFSKKIRHAYKLSENQLSVAAIGIKYLKERYGDLSQKKILLIGTGAMGQLILRYLELLDNATIYLTNRTFNKDKVDYYISQSIHLIEYEDRYETMKEMDIVISATASPHTVIILEEMYDLSKATTFLDMAVPRDIDAAVDGLSLANVVTLDDFDAIASQHMKMRYEVAQQINRLILEEVKALELWIFRSKADSIIHSFHRQQQEIIEENKQSLATMHLSDEQKEKIEALVSRSTWAMIKEPVKQLKALKETEDMDQYKMILEKLFNFDRGDQ